jgi:hypothetical protein
LTTSKTVKNAPPVNYDVTADERPDVDATAATPEYRGVTEMYGARRIHNKC